MWLRYEPSGKRCSHGNLRVGLDPPEKIGARGASPTPHYVAEEVSIRQAQHARAQGRQDMRGQGDFAGRAAGHLGSEQDMRAVFHQGDEADLRIGAFAVARAGPAEGGLERWLVGDVERAAVEADQAPMLEPGALGRRRRDRPHRLVVQAAHGLLAEPRASLRNAGFSGHLDRRREAFSHWRPSNRQRNTSRHDAFMKSAIAMT